MASFLGGGTPRADYSVSSLTRPSARGPSAVTRSCHPDIQEGIRLLNRDLFNMKYPKMLLCSGVNKMLHNLESCQTVFFW